MNKVGRGLLVNDRDASLFNKQQQILTSSKWSQMWLFFQQELRSPLQTDIKPRKFREPSEIDVCLDDCWCLSHHVTSVNVLFYMIIKGHTHPCSTHTGLFTYFAWLCRLIKTAWACTDSAWLTFPSPSCCTYKGTVTLLSLLLVQEVYDLT